jgi:hypothetical protein
MSREAALRVLAARWTDARANERGNFQTFLIELCEALGVERPGPSGSGYEFELPIRVITKEGEQVSNFIDCYRRDFFAIEAKDDETGRSRELLMRRAFGQVRNYVTYAPGGLPPFLMVMDVARLLLVWNRWTGNYGDWQAARRIDLTQLAERPDDVALLQAIWTDPNSLDPRARAQAVTKEVAGHLANLARRLEQEYEQERVARFIMRCVFTMFAEDIGLLNNEPFRHLLERCTDEPAAFAEQAAALWKAMDSGDKFEWKKLMRFNGHFFRDSEALPLTKGAILILRLAAEADWQDVEPAIFGTLLTRALDPKERHRLGAEFTPREFVERVVRPTVEEPIRERWVAVQADVLQLKEGTKADRTKAEKRLREFHVWLKNLRFLDPACGSGNFLYVTMNIVKLIELEVLKELEEVTGKHELLLDEVHPKQFFGIEIKAWAREIAELVLWIGYHQFWRAHHDRAPKEPILQDTGTIEWRDAVLTWDEIRHEPTRDRPDPTPRIRNAVTGELIPDPAAIIPYEERINACQARWPEADFIFGNPPYMGQWRQREEFGDGYVDALRGAYEHVPDTADYVMYWWYRAAEEVAAGRTIRAGLITTNTLTQAQNRQIITRARRRGTAVVWAIPDHPWTDDGAAVRVAMTVLGKPASSARRIEVDDNGTAVRELVAQKLNDDLTAHADVTQAAQEPLLANTGLCSQGFKLHGAGFILGEDEARRILALNKRYQWVVRPYMNGRDLSAHARGSYVIDFGLSEEEEAKQYPHAYQIVRDRVRPERIANRRPQYSRFWWRFGEPRREWREMSKGLERYIATIETAKHRFFVFLDAPVAPDNKLTLIASDDPFVLGVLSAQAHVQWALAAGGRLEDRPVYVKTTCFDPFPFPKPTAAQRKRVGDIAERIDRHRKEAIASSDVVTMTGLYNVIEKLRSGESLNESEREVYNAGACGVLYDLHDELDRCVAQAYSWEWPLDKESILASLVALHAARRKEEKGGSVQWLRPEYQASRYGETVAAQDLGIEEVAAPRGTKAKRPSWPGSVVEQVQSIKQLLSIEVLSAKEIASRFNGAKPELIRKHLEILHFMGEVQRTRDGRFQSTSPNRPLS